MHAKKRLVGSGTVHDGEVTIELRGVGNGKRTLTLAYGGDDQVAAASVEHDWKG